MGKVLFGLIRIIIIIISPLPVFCLIWDEDVFFTEKEIYLGIS